MIGNFGAFLYRFFSCSSLSVGRRRNGQLARALLLAATGAILFSLVSSQPLHVLKKGSSLSVERFSDDVLVSEGHTFTAGFYQVGENAFAFAVWFTVPGTVVWMANRDRPVNGRESRLDFRKTGEVALIDADGSTVWATNTSSSGFGAEQLEIGEDGNLVVRNGAGSAVWESFDFPTDTLLAFQGMTRTRRLVSNRGEKHYTSGLYHFYFDDENVLKFLYDGPELSSVYWPNPDVDIFQNGRTRYNSTRYASFDDLGRFTSSDNLQFSASDFGMKNKRRLTMDFDGVLRLYSLNSTNGWEVTWLPVLEKCRVHGLCGQNGICSYNPEAQCTCPPGHKMRNSTDWTQGCQPDFDLVCNKSEVQSVKLPHTDYYGYDLSTYRKGISIEACKNICLSDCNCRGFEYRLDGSGSCFPKNILFNGQSGPNIPGDLYIKVPSVGNFANYLAEEFNIDCSKENLTVLEAGVSSISNPQGDYLKLTIGFVVAVGIVEIICVILGCAYLHKESGHIHNIDEGYIALTSSFRRFTYQELKRATKNFSSEIGRGGSGVVYKGVLEDEKVVAVKRLEGVNQGEAQFWSEVSIIGRINHINLVRMLGFCSEKQNKLLVYEYMENGSLEKNLFNNSAALTWEHRFNIALGTAKGLAYLHEECLEWVLHCDIKPQNILLDNDFLPKVADFGLSKLLDRGGNNISSFSRVRGTRGYMAPEWILNMPITSKVDVYSYGILVLEMVTGRSSVGFQQIGKHGEFGSAQLIPWVRQIVRTRQQWIEEIADPSLSGMYDKWQMEILVQVALNCVEEESDARPTMSQVIDTVMPACL